MPTTFPSSPSAFAKAMVQSHVPQHKSNADFPFFTFILFIVSFLQRTCWRKLMIEFILSYLSEMFSKTLKTFSSFDCPIPFSPFTFDSNSTDFRRLLLPFHREKENSRGQEFALAKFLHPLSTVEYNVPAIHWLEPASQ